jgi:TonB family protein
MKSLSVLFLLLCLKFANAQVNNDTLNNDLSEVGVNPNQNKTNDNIADSSIVYSYVHTKPLFMNDSTERLFAEYIQKNIQYPLECKSKKYEGVIYIEFVITKTGKVDRVRVLRGINCESLNLEALKVVQQSPNWTPGKNNGVNVSVKKIIAIRNKKI